MQKKGFTLIEMIFVVVISGVLAMGSFKAIQALYLRSAKVKAVTELSIQSQIVLDQIGVMLYNRVPNSVIGSSAGFTSCEPIAEVTVSHNTLQWLGTMDDELLNQDYDGFVDISKSDKSTNTLETPNIKSSLNNSDINLIFAGAFDSATESIKACNGAFGFNSSNSDLAFDVTINNNNIVITDTKQPEYIYEKYYLTKTAYAITRGEHVGDITNCSGISSEDNFTDLDNTLFLFYNYQPYLGETFCGDGGVGNVSILAENVHGFEAVYENDAIRIKLDMNREIRGSSSVHISKQKVIF